VAVIVVKPRLGLVAYEVCAVVGDTEDIIPFSHTHTHTQNNLVISKVKQL
jgi:hypothetical protein